MRINTEALTREGWTVDFDAETGIIEIYSDRGRHIDMTSIEDQLADAQMHSSDIAQLCDDFVGRIIDKQIIAAIDRTADMPIKKRHGKKAV